MFLETDGTFFNQEVLELQFIVRCLGVPHADDNRIGPCRVQQQRGSRAQQEQQEIQGPTTLIMGSDHGSTL